CAAASDAYSASATSATAGSDAAVVGTSATGESNILNGQVSLGVQWSTIHTTVSGAAGDVIVQGQGAGNALDITTFNDTHVTSTQNADSAAIGSSVFATVNDVGGGVSISSQAFCNSTNVSTDPAITEVHSDQTCRADDPASEVNATVNNVAADVSIASSAFGNTYMEDTNALNSPATIRQNNISNVFSTVNSTVHNVGGSVAVTSSAIGNNAQIVHYSTDGATTGQ
ncbi:MAG TPA: hypothetical protein VGC36_03540, partial [Rhizomicrobium sp.]